MKHRVGALVGPVAEKMWVSTFHSACVRILRRDADRLGYPKQFTIYDQADAVRLTGYVIRDLGLDTEAVPAPHRSTPRSARPRTTTSPPTPYAERAGVIYERKIADVFREYQARLLRGRRHGLRRPPRQRRRACSSATPTCSSTTSAASSTSSSTSTRTPTPSRTSSSSSSTRSHRNVCVVGDGDQSIYRFRGADMRNILEFENGVPGRHGRGARAELPVDADDPRRGQRGHRQQPRRASRRSCGPTRATATRSSATTATTRSTRRSGSPARSPGCTTAATMRWGDVAVFYRTNAQSRVLEEHLTRHGIPYKVIGGTRFYDRREVKDALAYLKAVVQPGRRGVGEAGPQRPQARHRRRERRQARRLRHRPRAARSSTRCGRPTTPASAAPAVKGIARLPRAARRRGRPRRPTTARRRCSRPLLERSGYLDELQAERTIESRGPAREPGRAGRLRPGGRERSTQFLEQVSLVSDADEIDGDDSQVVLMTIHAAKGLEFPAVFIIGLEDGVFPHLRSIGEPDEMEEERRLAYVAHHPGPGAALPHPRVEPHALRRHAVQPAEPVPRRDPRASWSRSIEQRRASRGGRTYGRAARAASSGGYGSSGAGVTSNRDRIVERAMRPATRPGQARRRGARASRSATTCATPPSARA